jgi:hypothetical protein
LTQTKVGSPFNISEKDFEIELKNRQNNKNLQYYLVPVEKENTKTKKKETKKKLKD